MADKDLAIADIAQLFPYDRQFAFSSACQSAMRSTSISSEFVHIAASLQFAGSRGVAGTMWSVVDDAGVASEFYKSLLNGDTSPDPSKAAVALNKACNILRIQESRSVAVWAFWCLMHMWILL
jgi:CHAT domain-containing protein